MEMVWIIAFALLARCAFGQASVPYSQNFEGTIGSEWSVTNTISHPTYTRVLGNFGNTGTTLSVTTIPGREYEIVFDLWAFDSWDGTHPTNGPDQFRILIDGSVVLNITPPNAMPLSSIAYGNVWLSVWHDRIYPMVTLAFVATQTTTTIEFDGEGLQALTDESWGLDNLSVREISPASIPYLATMDGASAPGVSPARFTTLASGDTILGPYDNNPVRLRLVTVAGERYTLIYDLWAFDSWDGGPLSTGDRFRVLQASTELFAHTIGSAFNFQTMPHSPELMLSDVGVGSTIAGHGWGDKLFRRQSLTFVATSSLTELFFDADNLTGGTDESWGLDNVRVVRESDAQPFLRWFIGRQDFALNTTNASTTGATTGAFWLDLNGDGTVENVQAGTTLFTRYATGTPFTGPAASAMLAPMVAMDADNNGVPELWHRATGGSTQAFVYSGVGTSAAASNRVGQNASLFGAVSGLRAIVPLDADGDGRIDLVMMGSGGNRLALNMGTRSDGTLESFRLANLPSASADVGSGAWAATGDLNNDTIPDVYWSNGTGRLWLSNGAGGYVASDWGMSVVNSTANPAGATFADIDNDRDLDMFVGRRGSGLPPTLWINTGSAFVEQASSRGLGGLRDIVDASFGDIDNDGDLDMFFVSASGLCGTMLNGGSSGGYNFVLSDVGLVTETRGGDSVLMDVDGDGDLDASITSEHTALSRHWRNVLNNGTRSLTVRVIGKGEGYINRAGIGTRVELWDASNTQFLQRRDVGLAKGAGGMTPLWVHFGGVDENTTYTLRVWGRGTVYSVPVTPGTASTTFPSGTRQRFYTFDENVHAPRVQVVQYREVGQGE
jgi:hypothetical protein